MSQRFLLAQASPTPGTFSYPKGVWSAIPGTSISAGIQNKLGLVGLGVGDDWSAIQTGPSTYNWTNLDARVAAAKAAGFKVGLSIAVSTDRTPDWLVASLPAGEKLALLDGSPNHSTYCQFIDTPVYWSPTWLDARANIITRAGARYASDPAIVAVNTAGGGLSYNSNDFNIQDTVGTIVCPDCPQPPPTECGDQVVDQVQQWLDKGWTVASVFAGMQQTLSAAVAAFPNKAIKCPLGGVADSLITPFVPTGGYGTLADMLVTWIKANGWFGNRVFIQRATVDATWKSPPKHAPPIGSDRYIKWLIASNPGHAGLQMVSAASLCVPGESCRANGNEVCVDPMQVMQDMLNAAEAYSPVYTEIWTQDGSEPDFDAMVHDMTLTMGGTPR